MNPVISFVAIVSLLLAVGAAGNTAKEQAQCHFVNCGGNHNETMVRETNR